MQLKMKQFNRRHFFGTQIIFLIFYSVALCAVIENDSSHFETVQHFREVFPFLNDSAVPDHLIRFVEHPAGNYTGQMSGDGLREGWGEILWSNGTLYGPNNIFYYSAGDKYFGQWMNDVQEGETN
jgi:hypothetical protein